MFKKKMLISALLLASLASTMSCKKKDDPAPSGSTEITGKNWKLKSLTLNGSDASSTVPACSKDDYQTFKSDGTYTITDAGTKCTGTDPADYSGEWKLINNNTKFVEDGDTSNVEQLTATTFSYSQTETGNGVTVKYVTTLTTQ